MWTQQVRVSVAVGILLSGAYFLLTTADQRSDLRLLLLFVLTIALPFLALCGFVMFIKWDIRALGRDIVPLLVLPVILSALLLGSAAIGSGAPGGLALVKFPVEVWGQMMDLSDPFEWHLSRWLAAIIGLGLWTIVAWQAWIVFRQYLKMRAN